MTNLIWLSQVPPDKLPTRPHNIVGANLTWELLLNVAAQMTPPEEDGDEWILRAWDKGAAHDVLSTVRLLTQKIEPTRLDRVRMARLTESALKAEWFEELGKKQLIFRGRGGTGKTMLLLQMAWRAWREQGARVLLLTYNTALLADLRRLLTLVGDVHDAEGQSIQAQTIMAFFASAFRGLGLIDRDTDYLDSYADLKQQALTLATAEDISTLLKEHTEAFAWDYLFVDEAQDWPEDERDLLRRFYPASRFVLADGVDQFVRAQKACDWQAGVGRGELRVIPLTTCLRMKANLAAFANQLAAALGLGGWKVEANEQALGGRVILLEGDYFAHTDLHRRIVAGNAADGNQPVDMLMCVPPGLVRREEGQPARSLAAEQLQAAGQPVWDGVSTTVRDSYPTSVQQLRIVQYDSCRGLEGWAVICLGLDDLYRYKFASWQAPPISEPGHYADDPQAPHRHACRWLMIPLSRAVDTLVLQIAPKPSLLRDALRTVAEACPDFVEWHSQ